MKKRKLFAVVLCGLLALGAVGGAAGCASNEIASEQSEPEAVTGSEVVSTVEEVPEDNATGFYGTLEYASEKDDKLECSILLTALDGTFAEEVAAEDITFSGGFEGASDVKILENTKETLEVEFVLPKNDLDTENLSIDGSIEVNEGVLLDLEGKSAAATGESAVYTLPALDKSLEVPEWDEEESSEIEMKLVNGTYSARFYVTWDEVMGRDADGNYILEARKWEENGKIFPPLFKNELSLKNARNIKVVAQGRTGVAWEGWRTPLNKEYESLTENVTFTLKGAPMKQESTVKFIPKIKK